MLKNDPHCAPAYDGLVRALLGAHRTQEAYEAAAVALAQAPGKAPTLAASGRVLFRQGQVQKAEKAWIDALAIDRSNAAAMHGLARIRSLVAKYKSARDFNAEAFRLAPDDPALIMVHAAYLKGDERAAAIERALAIYDPESRRAKAIRAGVAREDAMTGITPGRLTSGMHAYRLPLMELHDGPRRVRGLALRVSFNGENPVTLLLDTGASGIALTPHLAERFGLRQLSDQSTEVHGIGNGAARKGYAFMASSVKMGEIEFQDYPLGVFDSAKSPDFDGLIGADVFGRFLVTIDFPHRMLGLEPFPEAANKQASDPKPERPADVEPTDALPLAPGLFRVFLVGHGIMVPTFINDDPVPHLFLLDSGAFSNVIDSAAARASTKTRNDSRMKVKGVQGTVSDVSRADEATLVFAGFRQKNPGLIAIDMQSMNDEWGVAVDGILGFSVLANLKMKIDYRDAGVRFEYQAK